MELENGDHVLHFLTRIQCGYKSSSHKESYLENPHNEFFSITLANYNIMSLNHIDKTSAKIKRVHGRIMY